MNERQLFDALAKDGDCWHESVKQPNDDWYSCKYCSRICVVPLERENPNFTNPTWTDWGWIAEKLDWYEFMRFIYISTPGLSIESAWVTFELISLKQKVELVRQFLEERGK